MKMGDLPPRNVSTSRKSSKENVSPTHILLQMGFPRQRAMKALAATGNRSAQLASDWLRTHVTDPYVYADEPREYIFYASPRGPLLARLLDFFEKSKETCGWNGAHSFPPHITLVSFFKAPDEVSLKLTKAAKVVVEKLGEPPTCPIKLEPYVSHNFMGLFLLEEHASYLKNIAVQYRQEVINVCPDAKFNTHIEPLHITLAYHFDMSAYEKLKALVADLEPLDSTGWELRLYSRTTRYANHQVYKVTRGYTPEVADELKLVLGDTIYIEEKERKSSTDGWVLGTSWLTGVTGYLPAVYTQRTADVDAWTLHRAISVCGIDGSDSFSESESNSDGEMAGYPHEDAAGLGFEKSEETYKEWEKYWTAVTARTHQEGIMNPAQGPTFDWKDDKGNGIPAMHTSAKSENGATNGKDGGRRWIFGLRHGERVDLTYGQWTPYCFQNDTYIRKDLNMPLSLPERAGGAESYARDSPLTRVGRLQARLVGEGLRLAGVAVARVYASAALRCVETAHEMLRGLEADPSVKVKVEPGLFEYKYWHMAKGLAPFMTPQELHKGGYNVDLSYKPYINLDVTGNETIDEFYKRHEVVITSAYKDSEGDGNIIFVGHAATLDMMVTVLKRMGQENADKNYQISKNLLRVPYCALAAMRDQPLEAVEPPCPPSINSSSGRYDWKSLLEIS